MANKRVLISPLDWGLGHATRCIPVIDSFMRHGAEVIICAYGDGLQMLREHFPDLQTIQISGIKINYQKEGGLVKAIFKQLRGILKTIRNETQMLDHLIDKYKLDAVISDSRYGFHSQKIPCVFITHQLQIQMPKSLKWLQGLVNKKNYSYINQFQECWVPDEEGNKNIAGKLSHPKKFPKTPVQFIGPLTRMNVVGKKENKWTAVIVLSGPEPQRTILEEKLRTQLKYAQGNFLLVKGLQGSHDIIKQTENMFVVPFLNNKELYDELSGSEVLICRSGYSSIMDLTVLKMPAVFIPTPGQTEQEYLAEKLLNENCFYSMTQSEFDLKKALSKYKTYKGFDSRNFVSSLDENVKRFLKSLD